MKEHKLLIRNIIPVVTLLAGFVAAQTALAGACEPKTRTDILNTNELHFENQTSHSVSVTFYDESVSTESQVTTKTIPAGDSAHYKQNASKQTSHTAIGVIAAEGSFGKTTCSVKVKKFSKGFPDLNMYTKWLSSDCSLESGTGEAYSLTCDRSYHPNDGRWKTIWTLKE